MNKILVSGKVQGIVLKSNDPINFLGTVDKKTGIVSDKNHDLFGTSIKDVILVFPSGVGSSVGAYTIYSIKSNKAAPLAMICKKADLTVATGCALANIPLITITDEKFSSLESGMKLLLDTDSSNLIHHQ
ncbi:aconitase X swivel domain-containing protein [Nitrosopumilus sp.]|uniref:aconitase X swivel domain-containing protein n=1 Tax=Nitrosopumilus sp. TaxID=2024843 RepID=UPI003B5946AC